MEEIKTTTFRERLEQVRNESGLSKTDAAELVGVPISTYHNWESGRAFPHPSTIMKIATAFDVTAKWLETGVGDKSRYDAELKEQEAREKKIYDSRVVYSAQDKEDLQSINTLITHLPNLDCPRNEKRKIHATLSRYRAELESKVLFCVGSINGM